MMGRCGGLCGSVGASPSRSDCQLLGRLLKGRTPESDGWGGIDVPSLTNQIEKSPWYLCHFNFHQTIGDGSTLLRRG